MGLSITKRLVDMMKGSIKLKSKTGKGSVFSVSIKDVDVGAVIEETEFDTAAAEIRFKGQAVIVAEDIASNREIVKEFLEMVNLKVISVENGAEAIDLLHAITPDLILMDMMMPVMDGYTATKNIRATEKYNQIPILALTASALKQNEDDIRLLCNDYLRKPISKTELVKTLSKYLEHDIIDRGSRVEEELFGENYFTEELKAALHGRFYSSWMEISELMSIDDIQRFSRDLEEYAKLCFSARLKTYASTMIDFAENFEIEQMNNIFLKFKDLIKLNQ